MTDLNFRKKSTTLCGDKITDDGCRVHKGFLKASIKVKNAVNQAVLDAIAANPDHRLVFTGHSLGGAIAALLGTMFRNEGYIADIVRP